MSVDSHKLSSHLDDYFRVMGRKTKRFICPITLRECDVQELIDGHILNKALKKASRRRVIQYGKIDHFFGSRVEPGLIRFLNLRHKNELDLLRESGELKVTLPDGSKVRAFRAGSPAAHSAEGHFPLIDLTKDGKYFDSYYLKIPNCGPKLSGQVAVTKTEVFAPFDWVAAMLKVGYLTLFEMLGYSVVFGPYGDTIRRSLAKFYDDRAPRKKAAEYFEDFQDAVKVIANKGELVHGNDTYVSYPFDTLDDREVLLHFTPLDSMFAATCIFKVNDLTITVTLPQSMPGTDPAVVLDWYQCFTENVLARRQITRRARFDGAKWLFEERTTEIGIIPQSVQV